MSCIVAGTFDHFHSGHEKLLDRAIETGKNLRVYIVDDDSHLLYDKLYAEYIETYQTREKRIREYLDKKSASYEVIPLINSYGDSIIRTDVDTIVCSKESKDKCKMINTIRQMKGREPLEIIVEEVVPYTSSTNIRAQLKDTVED